MSIKTKVGSTWQEPTPHVKVNGTWTKVKKAYGKVGGTWRTTYEYESVYTLSTGEQVGTIDFDALALDRHHNIRVVVPSGATLVAPSTSTYAIKTGTSHNAKITLENHGKIYGRGGNGGDGGYQYPTASSKVDPEAGGNGGDAIHIESAITIDNNGTIAGGGGGGGGGEGTYHGRHSGGGGGGGGAPYGTGGAGKTANGGTGTYNGTAGATAGLTSGGAGGAGAFSNSYGNDKYGGSGGNGGNLDLNGSAGNTSPTSYTHATGVGAKGYGGNAYHNPNSHTITTI